jgi:hypothetical protein
MPCLGHAHPYYLIECGSWAGFSQKAGTHRTRGGAGLAAASSEARGGTGPPPRWDGRSGPPGWPRRTGPLGVRLPHVGVQDHPAVVRARGSCF